MVCVSKIAKYVIVAQETVYSENNGWFEQEQTGVYCTQGVCRFILTVHWVVWARANKCVLYTGCLQVHSHCTLGGLSKSKQVCIVYRVFAGPFSLYPGWFEQEQTSVYCIQGVCRSILTVPWVVWARADKCVLYTGCLQVHSHCTLGGLSKSRQVCIVYRVFAGPFSLYPGWFEQEQTSVYCIQGVCRSILTVPWVVWARADKCVLYPGCLQVHSHCFLGGLSKSKQVCIVYRMFAGPFSLFPGWFEQEQTNVYCIQGVCRSILTVPWVELGGKIQVSCAKTGYSANIEFHTKVRCW